MGARRDREREMLCQNITQLTIIIIWLRTLHTMLGFDHPLPIMHRKHEIAVRFGDVSHAVEALRCDLTLGVIT